MPGVVPHLFRVLAEARGRSGKNHMSVGQHLDWLNSDRTLKRWESGDAFPPVNKLDQVIAAYCEETDLSVNEAWSLALERAGVTSPVAGVGDAEMATAEEILEQSGEARTGQQQDRETGSG